MQRGLAAAAAALAAAALAAWLVHAYSGLPSAEPGHGSEDAFATGLNPRELVPGKDPMRWSRAEASFRFRNLPAAPYSLEVRIRGHQGAVAVLADGAPLGEIPAGRFVGRFEIAAPAVPGRLAITLRPSVLRTEDRTRGVLVDRVKLGFAARGALPFEVLLVFLVAALSVLAAALAGGFSPPAAAMWAVGGIAVEAAAVWSDGLVRSAYAWTACAEIAAGAALAALIAIWMRSQGTAIARGAFAAMALAATVHVVAAMHPSMVVSDALFHANKLERLGRGEWFPTSETQHAQPFRFPYGVSFYAALLPFDGPGVERVALVRWGAALASLLGAAVLIRAFGRTLGIAGVLGVAAVQLLPLTVSLYSFGNLSNIFGQAVTAMLLAWWLAAKPHAAVGALLVAVAATAHLSSLIVLVAVVIGMTVADRANARGARLLGTAAGFLVAAFYYAHFFGMIAAQAPRLLEGGGQGTAEVSGFLGALVRQSHGVAGGLGLPIVALAVLGLAGGSWRRMPPAVRGYALGALALLLPALVSPLEVRYLPALAPIVGLLAADGFLRFWSLETTAARLSVCAIVAAQAALLTREIVTAVFYRYRV